MFLGLVLKRLWNKQFTTFWLNLVYQKTIYSTKKQFSSKAVQTSSPQKLPHMKNRENQEGMELNQVLVQVL
jgi:hypothetical protein